MLADHYEDDWSALWSVRADGRARVLSDTGTPEAADALDLLAQRYAQYRTRRPAGPVVALDVERITGWAAVSESPLCVVGGDHALGCR